MKKISQFNFEIFLQQIAAMVSFFKFKQFNIMRSRRSWTEKEDQMFSRLAKEYQPKNWAVIAKKMTSQFGFKRRSGKQCRQRWYNHLVPGISKKIWSQSEEDKLMLLHKKYGNKWTVIADHMPGRTDNSIKNYFYSTVRRSLRRMGKLIGSKNSTSLMRQIKPSTLTRIFGGINQQKDDKSERFLPFQEMSMGTIKQTCQNVRDEIIQFSTYKPKRKDFVSEEEIQKYENVFSLILKLNQIYQKQKDQQKNKKSQQQIFKQDYKQMMNQESQIDESNSSQSLIVQEQNIQLARTRSMSTRTRSIKIPEKLNSNIYISAVPQNQHNQKITMSQTIKQIKKQKIEAPLIINLSKVDDYLEEGLLFQDPQFQIELQDQISALHPISSNPINQSPSFYFGTPNNQINFFKSPMAGRQKSHFATYISNLQQNTQIIDIQQSKNGSNFQELLFQNKLDDEIL